MAANLEQRRKQRFQFLRSLYEMSRGSERVLFYIEEVGDAIGLGQLEAEAAAQYLAEKRLIRVVMKHIISISQAGADELETALEQPEQPTAHFPPAQSVPAKPLPAAPPAIVVETPPIREIPIPEVPVQQAPVLEALIQEASIRQASIQPASSQPLPAHIVENDSDELAAADLMRICEAIGLDPQEFSGELAPHHSRLFPEPVHEEPVHERDPAPVNQALIHAAPIREEPVHQEPIHEAPISEAPIREAPVRDEPIHESPLLFKKADLDVILESLSLQLPKLGLAPGELAKVQAENDTARAQLASPRPEPGTLATALRTLLSILENAGPLFASDTRENLIAIRDFEERLNAKTTSRSAAPRKRNRAKAMP